MNDPGGGYRPLLLLPERVPPAATGGMCADDGIKPQADGAGFIPFVVHNDRLGVLILRSAIRELRLSLVKQGNDREGLTGRMDQYELPGGACDGQEEIAPYKAASQELWEEGSGLFHVDDAALMTLRDNGKVQTVGAGGRPGYRAFYGLLTPMNGSAFPLDEAKQTLQKNYAIVRRFRKAWEEEPTSTKVPSCWCENSAMELVLVSDFLKSYKTMRSGNKSVELRSFSGDEAANHLVRTNEGVTVALFARDANALIKVLKEELGLEKLLQGLDYEHTPDGKEDKKMRAWEKSLLQALKAHPIGLTGPFDVTEAQAKADGRFWLADTKEYKGSIA